MGASEGAAIEHISIHALLAESDERPVESRSNIFISIHALLAESDAGLIFFFVLYHYFYPRSPCGERQNGFGRSWRKQSFLSTLSLRRATEKALHNMEPCTISIHALLAESDTRRCQFIDMAGIFLSTLSLRRATYTQRNSRRRS